MVDTQELLPHDLNLEAVTAITRYEAPETVRWPQDPDWVSLHYIYNSKKRIHRNYSFEIFQQIEGTKGNLDSESTRTLRGRFGLSLFLGTIDVQTDRHASKYSSFDKPH